MESPLYKRMNEALRSDDKDGIRSKAGYIMELRDVLRVGKENAVVEPFTGTVYRGVEVTTDFRTFLRGYYRGAHFVWPAFTSTSTDKSTCNCFQGKHGVMFKIVCTAGGEGGRGFEGKYAPASISNHSAYPRENEVLFPPQTMYRVTDVRNHLVPLPRDRPHLVEIDLMVVKLPHATAITSPPLVQYYVGDGVDGKGAGWYNYTPEAGIQVTKRYCMWREGRLMIGMCADVRSGCFVYDVFFDSMTQMNTTHADRKVRQIRLSYGPPRKEKKEKKETIPQLWAFITIVAIAFMMFRCLQTK